MRSRNPVNFVALLDAEVLVRPIAPPDVMADQLRHLLRMSELRTVTVQIVSTTVPGYHPGLAGPFELIEFAQASPIVLLDHHRSSAFLWDEEDVQEFVKAAAQIREAAMTPAETAEVIAKIVHGMETTE